MWNCRKKVPILVQIQLRYPLEDHSYQLSKGLSERAGKAGTVCDRAKRYRPIFPTPNLKLKKYFSLGVSGLFRGMFLVVYVRR